MNILNRKHRVHLSIKDRYIRFVESGKKHNLLAYGQKSLPDGVIVEGQIKDRETLELIVEEMVDQWKLKGKKVSFCVPDSTVIVRTIHVPNDVPDHVLNGYLYMELGHSIHLPFSDPLIEAVPLEQTAENRDVLLFASRETVLNEWTELLKGASLKPDIADLSMLSLYRMYYHLGLAKQDEHVLFVQIGLDAFVLSVFYEHKPVFSRHYPLEFHEEHYELSKSRSGSDFYAWMGVVDELTSQSQDITMEIERFLSYYRFNLTKGKHHIAKIVLSGDHPCMETFYKDIHTAIEVSVQPLLEPLFQTKKGRNIPPVYAECIGLALK
ncbi:type IV pilus biogenesis protein PilM [Bacillus cihuensis]|uniref:type IV pilus biogenesis protein PilM n=1 Tax=Bacillus cihuensis TaxID=1208599 RepID=UPI00042A8CC1|nr:pilus assembly protein PilM [Bacillus cihuensis]